jgi:hypothetical protein
MVDRTQAGARVYGVPEEVREEVGRVFEAQGFGGSDPNDFPFHESVFTDTIYEMDTALGTMRQVADALDRIMQEHGVQFAYELNEETYSPYLGALHIYVPGVGRFDSDEADDEGEVVFSFARIEGVLDASTDIEDARRRFRELMGLAQGEAISALRELERLAHEKDTEPIYPWQQG